MTTGNDIRANTNAAPPPNTDEKRKGWLDLLPTWLGVVTGVIALVLSLANWVTLNRKPEVTLSLPPLIRIAQEEHTWLYLQPTFSTMRKTETTDYITDMELRVRPLTGSTGSAAILLWDETGSWTYDPKTQETTWTYESDPQPLLVTQESPRSPTALFTGHGWRFAPGRYELELRARRSSGWLAFLRGRTDGGRTEPCYHA